MRYPRAKWVGCAPENYSTLKIVPKFFVLHIAEGNNQSGMDAWFHDPAAQVSAHLSASKLGFCHEYVAMDEMAYHCGPWNDRAIGMEFCGYWGDSMTWFQRRTFARAALWAHHEFKIPLRLTFDPNDPAGGFLPHGVIPEGALSHPQCPGEPILVSANKVLHRIAKSRKTERKLIRSAEGVLRYTIDE